MKLKHRQYTHKSLAKLLFLNALVTAAAGLDSASKLVCFAQKWAWHECKSGRDQNFRALCWRAPPTVRNSGQILHSVDHLGQAWLSVVRNWEMSAIQVFLLYINDSEFSWYIKHCPLLGRGPLLGASVNGELTVLHIS